VQLQYLLTTCVCNQYGDHMLKSKQFKMKCIPVFGSGTMPYTRGSICGGGGGGGVEKACTLVTKLMFGRG
jgi:hypothetical protein